MDPGPAAPFPREIRQAGPDALKIVWNDGHESVYPVVLLRRSCRCAACVDEWTGEPILDPGKVSERVRPIELNPVGRYALSILWNDGHSSGIYTFEHLRSLCPCDGCRRGRGGPVPGYFAGGGVGGGGDLK